MRRILTLISIVGILLAACAVEPVAVSTPTTLDKTAGVALPMKRNAYFAGSGLCVSCHNSMFDEAGKNVSTDYWWKASMMANSARDPYWQASVRSEVLNAPLLREVIEDKCATCHMPMAATSAHLAGKKATALALNPQHPDHALGLDGVSCSQCHQILPAGLGQKESFSGHYTIDPDKPVGQRPSFGPFEVQDQFAQVMAAVSGFLPVQGKHLYQSEVCATCHTLYTPFVDANGQIAGEFPEQMPYLEWLNSDYRLQRACNQCHMPEAQGGVQLATTGGPKRSPVLRHSFSGANVYMGRIFLNFGKELNLATSTQEQMDMIAATTDLLQSQTAALALENFKVKEGRLTGQIQVRNQAGHKFPTSFPSRRAWLHIVVADSSGRLIFESGNVDAEGAIQGNENDADPTRYEPHYQVLTTADQVQIYEPVMGDTEGKVTTGLLRAAQYLKDNRLLPAGFDKAGASPDIAVRGEAAGDADFLAGGDTLSLEIDLGQSQGAISVRVELLYQSIGYRWAMNLKRHPADEITRFLDFYRAVPNRPLVVTSAQIRVEP